MGPKNKIMIKELANASKVMIDTAPLVYFIEEHDADIFLTNDELLKKVTEINVVVLEEIIGIHN